MDYSDYSFAHDKNVCSKHFYDDSICKFINDESKKNICDYCHKKTNVISLEHLYEFLIEGISKFYGNPDDEGVGFDSSEGGYLMADVYDKYDLISDVVGLDIIGDDLYDDICDCFEDSLWCQTDPYNLPEDEMFIFDWKYFCDLVKHKIRYTFFKYNEFNIEPEKEFSSILYNIAQSVEASNLITPVSAAKSIYRCRQHKENELVLSMNRELASPPQDKAIFSNRMSPSGISMFYGSFDEETAVKEAVVEANKKNNPFLTVGRFVLRNEINVIDFRNLPNVPSIFDRSKRHLYYKISFLKSFAKELSKDIVKDEKAHIEYVPTQILTEFFRFVFPGMTKSKIDGIIYPSSKNKGGDCCVFFFDNKECLDHFELQNHETKLL